MEPVGADRDLFELEAANRLAGLVHPPALWPADRQAQWPAVIAGAVAFARRWDRLARACGWTTLQLYGLHRHAPWQNLAASGAAFICCSSALEVSERAILMATATGSRLRVYRRPPDPASVLAWEIYGGAGVR